MDDTSDKSGDVVYAGKIKTQTFKQLQLERLIKNGTVIPAAKLAETQAMELQRVRDFALAAAHHQYAKKTGYAHRIAQVAVTNTPTNSARS